MGPNENQLRQTMNYITLKKCPLCNGTAIVPLFKCKDRFATGEEFHIHKCSSCGFTFTQDFPDEKEIGRYYESPTYISHSNTDKGVVNKVYHIARTIMLQRKRKLVEKLTGKRNGKLLDFGAGTGYFARTMQDAGWEVTAIEKSGNARELALKKFGLKMLPEEKLKETKDKSLDVVTMWHVMEHIQDLDQMWKELHRILEDTGIAVIAVPNSISYDAKRYMENWAAYDVPRHLWHFTPDTIKKWGEKHGFVLEKEYTMPLDGFYISMLSERYKGSGVPGVRGLWTALKGWFAQWTRRDASSSIIYVFRKRR